MANFRREAAGHEVVRVWLLGGFRVSVGERTVGRDGWRLRKAASLVKLLVLAPGHRLHREQVMDLLWPDLDIEAAANNLRQALHAARKTLAPEGSSKYLLFQGEQIILCPDSPLLVDVEAFEEAAGAARRSRDLAAYATALDLYTGDLLPEDRYEPWAEGRRQGLRGAYLGLLVGLARVHEERREIEEAAEALERAVGAEPALEEAHAGLMGLYAASGWRDLALRQYEQLREVLSRDDIEPGARVTRLHEDIETGRFEVDISPAEAPEDIAGRHNLPISLSSFVGRERELVEIKRAFSMTRLLTLTGVGGAGKTRLAIETARSLSNTYQDGAWLVELAPLSEGVLLPQEVAATLGVNERPGREITPTLVDALREKSLLLLLDNCEHLVDAAARLAETLLNSCPGVRVLATSREALGLAGETNWPVPPLSVPGTARPQTVEELTGYESARLFVERASSRGPGVLGSRPEDARAVAEICQKLDGIPLALELAAARVGALSVDQISARLSRSLELLTGGSRTATPRQRTLRGALDWSHRLLSEPEQTLFGRLSVFAGGWTLEAVEAVGAGGGIEGEDVLDLVTMLVDKSLVVFEGVRYRMLEPVRQYAREHLENANEVAAREAAPRRHAAWYLAFAEEVEPELIGPRQVDRLDQLEREHDNLRAAMGWFLEKGEAEPGLRLASALGEFWRVRGHLNEGLRWLEAALAMGKDASSARVKALVHAGWIAWESIDFERSSVLSEEALALSREIGDKAGAAAALYHLGMVAIYGRMQAEKAWTLFEESLALRREVSDEVGAGRTLQKMGLILVVRHDFERARQLHEQSLALAERTGDRLGTIMALWLGALAYLGLQDHQQVKELSKQGLDIATRLRHKHAITFMLNVLAASAGAQGLPGHSARLWGASESLLDSLGLSLGPAERYHFQPYVAAAREELGDAAWEAAKKEGRVMEPQQAIEYALSGEKPTKSPELPPADQFLPRRQREISALIARGLTNNQIAAELALSKRTVDTHVARILKKLGLQSRSQIATWATERRLTQ